jgi:hypothetical protein
MRTGVSTIDSCLRPGHLLDELFPSERYGLIRSLPKALINRVVVSNEYYVHCRIGRRQNDSHRILAGARRCERILKGSAPKNIGRDDRREAGASAY